MTISQIYTVVKSTRGNLFLLVGVPCSGKSTFMKKLSERTSNFVIISRDALVDEWAHNQGITYNEAFSLCDKEVNIRLQEEIEKYILTDENVFIDMTNLGIKRRKGLIKRFKNHVPYAVAFDIPDKRVLNERNMFRANSVGKFICEGILNRMIGDYVYPTKEEGFKKIFKVK